LIITAAHCLPFLPPDDAAYFFEDRVYDKLLGPLGQKPSVWAECLFVDPVSDLAILLAPSWSFVESTVPISIGDAPENGRGWTVALDGSWFECAVGDHHSIVVRNSYKEFKDPLFVTSTLPIDGGMSGSPILSDNGMAIGIVNTGDEDLTERPIASHNTPNVRLTRSLPGWMLDSQKSYRPELAVDTSESAERPQQAEQGTSGVTA
jgi:hypothetical protein